MVFMIIINCDDIDLTAFEVIDVRARIYLARHNQEVGPLIVHVNDNFRVVEVDEVEIPANREEVTVFIEQMVHPALPFEMNKFSAIPALRTMSSRITIKLLRTIKISVGNMWLRISQMQWRILLNNCGTKTTDMRLTMRTTYFLKR